MKILAPEINKLLSARETQLFLQKAKRFISILETKTIDNSNFLNEVRKNLSELYSSGLSLLNTKLIHSNENTSFEIEFNTIAISNNLHRTISENDAFYTLIHDPFDKTTKKPIQGWLIDDLVDIYLDLKEAIYKIEEITTNESIEDALYELKFGFHYHWGNHCINALKALHYIPYKGKPSI